MLETNFYRPKLKNTRELSIELMWIIVVLYEYFLIFR